METDSKKVEVKCLESFYNLLIKCQIQKISISQETKRDFLYSMLKTLGSRLQSFVKKAVSEGFIKWDENYEVEDIVDHCTEQGENFYLIKWKGWDDHFNSWEPEEHLQCTKALRDYFEYSKKTGKNLRKRKLEIEETSSNRKKMLIEDMYQKVLQCVENYDTAIKLVTEMKLKRRTSVARHRKTKKTLCLESHQALKNWEKEINAITKGFDQAYLYVENKVDFEGPPENFIYINERKEGPGVVIPKDPLIGCECRNCFEDKKNCCPVASDSILAYYKSNGRLRVQRGVPIYECNKMCKCGPDCVNRVVQKGRKFKLCIFRTDNSRGWGVKTLQRIKEGSFVVEYVGEVITNEEAEVRGKYYDAVGHTYLFDLDFNESDEPYTVDAGKYGNVAHFINHSCDPNLEVHVVWINTLDPQLPHICLFAKRDIQANEELTFDYMSGNVSDTSFRSMGITNQKTEPHGVESSLSMTDIPSMSLTPSASDLSPSDTLPFSGTPLSSDTPPASSDTLPSDTPPASDTESNSSTCETEANQSITKTSKFSMACLCGAKNCRKLLFF
ncbi:histone-lysine N-methyltransferase SUV39H2 [Biomphalaria glabrata]|uniref:Histone-lysine N-methyltransferase n=1 Tax=Biomphalaria glabrata TaxID=6526 RepID=A0A9W3A901_BIOGL|nr:histone-lysine N-methyltransferase SUV39H2-like [Biomphalaria glabrata]KAI8739436.1 histone-lysine N-methyltransferase SUV39H2-like; partial [Biomphalaria glabrata]